MFLDHPTVYVHKHKTMQPLIFFLLTLFRYLSAKYGRIEHDPPLFPNAQRLQFSPEKEIINQWEHNIAQRDVAFSAFL